MVLFLFLRILSYQKHFYLYVETSKHKSAFYDLKIALLTYYPVKKKKQEASGRGRRLQVRR
jgi:hypothetical protein